ncbi:MAG: TlpA family protein disulfide reductase [Acidobacteria bacterium]|nr:TlpA family protein disulfide reductase [Acidobacteriota bacterium]
MNGRRPLLLLIFVAGLALLWAASRYARQSGTSGAPDVAGARSETTATDEKTTLKFFRHPAAVAAFAARDLDGRDISPAALRGKVVIFNFWATWCPPCRAEIPDLIALQDKYRDQLQIIGISEDEESPEMVKRFAAEHKMNYPIVMATRELEKRFPGVSALPTSFIVDRESRVVQKHVGMLVAQTTEQETRALAGLPVNVATEEVEQTQGLKLGDGAQVMTIPGVDLAKLSPAKRTEALQKLNSQSCTCGCDLTVAKCRVDDPTCGVSLPLAREIVAQVALGASASGKQ